MIQFFPIFTFDLIITLLPIVVLEPILALLSIKVFLPIEIFFFKSLCTLFKVLIFSLSIEDSG
jgi:hypothetical protein